MKAHTERDIIAGVLFLEEMFRNSLGGGFEGEHRDRLLFAAVEDYGMDENEEYKAALKRRDARENRAKRKKQLEEREKAIADERKKAIESFSKSERAEWDGFEEEYQSLRKEREDMRSIQNYHGEDEERNEKKIPPDLYKMQFDDYTERMLEAERKRKQILTLKLRKMKS